MAIKNTHFQAMRDTISKKKKSRVKPGPKPEVLKIEGDWEEAVRIAMRKKKPKGGWPK